MLVTVFALVVALQDLKAIEALASKNPSAANYRALADAYLLAEQYDRASAIFFKASTMYAKLGDPNAAKVLKTQGERYETKIDIFYERPASGSTFTGAINEPKTGCYIGAFIDREDGIERTFVGNGQTHRDPQDFDKAVGKKHASYFTYLAYGRPFPTEWVHRLKNRAAAAHIAWEPRSIGAVQDDNYLRRFARDCRNSGVPIFLRFAGEMNGDWTRYHDDPEGYKRMFRMVADVMHDEAQNVAMVWCPNDMPENQISSFFPGDDAVDWVGVNFYSVLYNDGNRARNAEWRNPADSLKFVYNTYARKHPIMIGEWAATHMSVVDEVPRPDFAIDKIGQLYSALPRLYPRVKAVHWLSMNTIEHAMPGRQLNDFSLMSDSSVFEKYKSSISSDYYLNMVLPGVASPIEFAALTDGTSVSGKVRFSAVVKTYEQRPAVIWNVNGDPSSPKKDVGTYEVSVDTKRLGTKKAVFAVVVKDSKGRTAGKKEVRLELAN